MRNGKIAVWGGGLAGRLAALCLRRAGHEVVLFEAGGRDGAESAAYVAAAMLAPSAEAVDAPPAVVRLGWASLPLWRALLPTLPEAVWMQENGSVVVWHGQDAALSRQFVRDLERCETAVSRYWDAAEVALHEPQLAGRFRSAVFLPQEGQLDGRQVLMALAAALEVEGVDCRWHCAVEYADLGDFAWRVDCRGMGAQADWNRGWASMDADSSSRAALTGNRDGAAIALASGGLLRGVRGEVARVHAPEVVLQRPVRLLHPRYPLYIAPKENGIFVIGATQLESESRAAVRVRSGLELLSALYAVHPAFGEAEIVSLASGLRPTLPHHAPEIRYRPQSGDVALNGLFRHGFMIAPAVVVSLCDLLVRLMAGEVPDGRAGGDVAWVRG